VELSHALDRRGRDHHDHHLAADHDHHLAADYDHDLAADYDHDNDHHDHHDHHHGRRVGPKQLHFHGHSGSRPAEPVADHGERSAASSPGRQLAAVRRLHDG
jgi:hypothetical protein